MVHLNKKQKLLRDFGFATAKAYATWVDLRQRCNHPERKGNSCYQNISYCDSWNSFDNFLKDMGLPQNDQSIDRINSSGNYCPENCRWADSTMQARNRAYVKLSEEKAKQIREWYATGNVSQQTIANKYGVSQLLISRVVRNLQWI